MAIDITPTRVLVADDDFDSRELLAALLRQKFPESEIAMAGDGQEALDLAIRLQPSVVILDLEMPVLDGLSAARAVRARLGPKAPLLLALSGNSHKLAEAAAEALFDHYLLKPVSMDRLFVHVRDAMGPGTDAASG